MILLKNSKKTDIYFSEKIYDAIDSHDPDLVFNLFLEFLELKGIPSLVEEVAQTRINGRTIIIDGQKITLIDGKVEELVADAIEHSMNVLISQASHAIEKISLPYRREDNLSLVSWIRTRVFGSFGTLRSAKRSDSSRTIREAKYSRMVLDTEPASFDKNGHAHDVYNSSVSEEDELIESIDSKRIPDLIDDYFKKATEKDTIKYQHGATIWYLQSQKEVTKECFEKAIIFGRFNKKESREARRRLMLELCNKDSIPSTALNIQRLLDISRHAYEKRLELFSDFLVNLTSRHNPSSQIAC